MDNKITKNEEKVESENIKVDTYPEVENCCPKCNQVNPGGAQFCNNCGASLSTIDSMPKKKSHKKLWVILGSVIGVLVIAIIMCVAAIGNLSSEAKPIVDTMDAFMKALAEQDVEGAYTLTSPRFQQNNPVENLKGMITGDKYRIFEGYQSLQITNVNVNFGIPQTADVSGTISYINGHGEFTATMEKVNDNWMILGYTFRKYNPTPT